MAGLALYAMKKGNPSHVIFADKVLSGLIDNYDAREEIVNLYGAEIVQDFIKKRGEIDINIRGNNSE